MPSKLLKALGAVKDHTSISLAKLSKSSTSTFSQLDMLVLKATTHDEVPIDERYVAEILYRISTTRACATACVHALSRRIDRTHNWVVALKCLQLVFRAFQGGDRYFHREVLNSMRRGSRLLNLSGFRDESTASSPWDYTAFVRTFGLYLDERLDCVLLGKLLGRPPSTHNRLRNVKPHVILDRIAYWQSLLDRAIATRPTGPARHNRLVQISLCSIVLESFNVYRDVADGVDVLMDGFFGMPHWSRVDAYHTCARAAKQFEELSMFYNTCQSIGVGHKSNFPTVQMISETVLKTLEDFVKPNCEPKNPPKTPLLAPKEAEDVGEERRRQPRDSNDGDQKEKPSDKLTESKKDNQLSCTLTELLLFNDHQPNAATTTSSDEWEQILMQSANDISTQMNHNHNHNFMDDLGTPEVAALDNVNHQSSTLRPPLNPFLDSNGENGFMVAPTFHACNPNDSMVAQPEADPFASSFDIPLPGTARNLLQQEQQLWLTNQSKIIACRNSAA